MSIVTLLDLNTLNLELSSLDELLGVVPSATRVGGREGNLNTRDDASSEDTVGGLVTEEGASEERRDDDEDAWGDHLLQGSVGGDRDASRVISREARVLSHKDELSADFFEHFLSGITDSLHGHSGEPVWEHSTDEEASEGEGLEDVDLVGVHSLGSCVISIRHGLNGVSNAGHEGTEEGESDEAGRADGEALADSSGGVASSVESISSFTDFSDKVGHLGDSTGVVRDGAIAVNGEGNGEASEHANGGECDSVHGSELEGDEHSDCEAEDGDDAGEVAERETVDDVGGTAVFAGLSELLSGSVLLRGVVLGHEANGEAGPESKDDANVAFPSGGGVGLSSELDVGAFKWEHVDGGDDEDGHEDGGDPQLDLKGRLDLLGWDVGEELAEEGSDNTNSCHDEREVDGLWGVAHAGRSGGDDKSGAGGLSEGAEKISAHTSDVTNVVTDVVSNGAWVLGGVLRDGSLNLTSEISSDISSLGVDTATDSSEESDSGASETVARDELEEVLNTCGISWLKGSSVGEDEDLEDEEGEANEAEAEDLTALEGDLEALELVDVAEVGGLDVADGGNLHADVAAEHASAGSDDEGGHSVGERLATCGPRHVDGTEDHDGKDEAEDGKSGVFFFQESDSALKNI